MNSENFLKELSGKIIFSNQTGSIGLSHVEWRVQDSTYDSILFYKINLEKIKDFWERINNCQYGLLVLNKKIEGVEKLKNVLVVNEADWLEAQKLACDLIYPLPHHGIKFIGITGTNGKTTTTDLVRQIALQNNLKVMSIGTLGVKKNHEQLIPEGLTTPPYIDLRRIFFKYAKDVDWVVMEVSSHSLVQERVYKIKFDVAVWTSFSQDHLDFHQTLEEYFQAKCLLLEKHLKSHAPVFIPAYEEELFNKLSKYPQAAKTTTLLERKVLNLPLFFLSHFNKSNLEAAWDTAEFLLKKKIQPDLYQLEMTKGRFTIFSIEEKTIIIDFAHTPDAIANICSATKQAFPNSELHLVFGCGGDRDKAKRPLMGKAAVLGADKIYVTSDNPRFESPEAIIQDILEGINAEVTVIVKREDAIKEAFNKMKGGDVLIIAGKGHENYQIFGDKKIPYSDQAVIESLMGKK